MEEYDIRWVIQADGADPVDAALRALDMFEAHDSRAKIFHVTAPDGRTYMIDFGARDLVADQIGAAAAHLGPVLSLVIRTLPRRVRQRLGDRLTNLAVAVHGHSERPLASGNLGVPPTTWPTPLRGAAAQCEYCVGRREDLLPGHRTELYDRTQRELARCQPFSEAVIAAFHTRFDALQTHEPTALDTFAREFHRQWHLDSATTCLDGTDAAASTRP
ncbi:hypothetical protein [Nocardia aurea]|uniref:hypothetical protein n=1 Tax=Nocardia aurea TaxID=2144174 RepID=UPI000D6884A6|nr:hypothetical protein [Nocardia aurea]